MHAARIVFFIIGLLILGPIILFGIKSIWIDAKKKKAAFPWKKLVITLALFGVGMFFITTLYQFTIQYQAPLAAERFHEVFIKRVQGQLDHTQFVKRIDNLKLAGEDFLPIDEKDLREAGFENRKYQIFLSERIYGGQSRDAVIIYSMYRSGNGVMYTALELEKSYNQWKVTDHRMMAEDEISEIDSSMRFYETKIK